MQSKSAAYTAAIAAPVRQTRAKVEIYTGSTLTATYTESNKIISVNIQRIADAGRFFGRAICQRLNVHLEDTARAISITTANKIKVFLGVQLYGSVEYAAFPTFYVTEVNRDENSNELSITAYDLMHEIEKHVVNDLSLSAPYTVQDVINAAAQLVGTTAQALNIGSGETCFSTSYADGANFEGTENLKEVLRQAAEVTQTWLYIDYTNKITFKRLPAASSGSITKDKYFTCKSTGNRRLQTITSVTELGDNISVSTAQSGTTQYVRNNPFWELRDDTETLISNAITAVGDTTIGVFETEWRGDPALEIADKITITAKDNTTITSYLLDDEIEYNGVLTQRTQWQYTEEEDAETDSNPATIGDALRQTYARVDRANREISLVASKAERNEENISALQIGLDGITASVTEVKKDVENAVDTLTDEISTVTQQVAAKMSAEDVQIEITRAIENGVDKVTTSTGFTFNETGLNVHKSDSEMNTTITENGLHVYRNAEEVLRADSGGVDARNLHANTYLIIGDNARLEDYNGGTACYYIGG